MSTPDVTKPTNNDSNQSLITKFINTTMVNFVFTTVMREENRRRAERA
jgi:hypothetical protein